MRQLEMKRGETTKGHVGWCVSVRVCKGVTPQGTVCHNPAMLMDMSIVTEWEVLSKKRKKNIHKEKADVKRNETGKRPTTCHAFFTLHVNSKLHVSNCTVILLKFCWYHKPVTPLWIVYTSSHYI